MRRSTRWARRWARTGRRPERLAHRIERLVSLAHLSSAVATVRLTNRRSLRHNASVLPTAANGPRNLGVPRGTRGAAGRGRRMNDTRLPIQLLWSPDSWNLANSAWFRKGSMLNAQWEARAIPCCCRRFPFSSSAPPLSGNVPNKPGGEPIPPWAEPIRI